MAISSTDSLTTRTLRLAILRIGLVSLCAGAISYYINQSTLEQSVRKQLLLSTEQTLQRDALPFREIKELEQNFLAEFKMNDSAPGSRQRLAHEFDQIFYRHEDGSYTQRPGIFEGKPLPDGRRFAWMSATYAPEIPPNADIKARFALSFLLSHKFGSSVKGRLFNFYGVVPEKGFPIYQSADIAKVFTYSGPDALKLETYEFYSRGFASQANETIYTRMYWDYSNNAWMTTVATADEADKSGKHRILVCVDVLLDDLMARTQEPTIQGSHSTIFQTDADGTLIYHPDFMEEIKRDQGNASIKSLKIENEYALLTASQGMAPGKVGLIETNHELVAFGKIPETPWVFTIHYPKSLMQPAILQNLAVVVALGLLTLLVEIFIIRSILQDQVAIPLLRLIQATHQLGQSSQRVTENDLPTKSKDEIGELARAFVHMAGRVQDAQADLQRKIHERTVALEEANRKLMEMSTTDQLTGIANRRRFDGRLASEWRRAQRAKSYIAVAMIDVDWFKDYNDLHGHQAGDECLRKIAGILEAHINHSTDLVARYGGEEFVLVTSTHHKESALRLVQKICSAVEACDLPHEKSPLGRITISIGFAGTTPNEEMKPDDLLREADKALYRAKNEGRNRVALAETEDSLIG